MKLKDRIRDLRTTQNKTLKTVADDTGLSPSYISDIERGRTNPSLKTIDLLSSALNSTPQFLLNGVEFQGVIALDQLPKSLIEFIECDEFRDEIDQDWIALLNNIQLRGKRPQSYREWMELYLHLRRILTD